MPKSQLVNPADVRKPETLEIASIPINQYVPDFKKEEKKYGKEGLRRIYYDMLVIREFESMLDAIKKQGSYEGIEYEHKGPAHLSIGQESAAVGQSVCLDTDDFIFGSHRSHGEIIAKCFSAVAKLSDKALTKTMEEFMDGACLSVVEKGHKGDTPTLPRILCCTALSRKYLQEKMGLTEVSVDRCMPFLRLSEATLITL